MIANYHAHTWRCSHASGTEREYVEAALDRGLKLLGFSDHTPYPFPESHDSWFRMKVRELDGYVTVCQDLRREYQNSIEIHIGLEAEYYPAYFRELTALLKDSGVEYLLLGQHFMDNEIGACSTNEPTADPERLKRYCHQTMDAMQTGLFTYFAHPDIICFTGDRNVYAQQIRQLCREANACAIPLEINLLGLENGKRYPVRRFWEIAAEENCKVILGCDTHAPEALRNTASERQARAMAAELGIELLDTVPLRPIR